MTRENRKPFNPFYPMLIVAGVVFCVTACGYGVMTVRKLRNPREENPPAFIEWMDEKGFTVMMVELGALAVLSFAAMGTDSYWSNRAVVPEKPTVNSEESESEESESEESESETKHD